MNEQAASPEPAGEEITAQEACAALDQSRRRLNDLTQTGELSSRLVLPGHGTSLPLLRRAAKEQLAGGTRAAAWEPRRTTGRSRSLTVRKQNDVTPSLGEMGRLIVQVGNAFDLAEEGEPARGYLRLRLLEARTARDLGPIAGDLRSVVTTAFVRFETRFGAPAKEPVPEKQPGLPAPEPPRVRNLDAELSLLRTRLRAMRGEHAHDTSLIRISRTGPPGEDGPDERAR